MSVVSGFYEILKALDDPTVAPPSIPEKLGWVCLDDTLSNFDHEVPSGMEDKLRQSNCWCYYCAWNFCAHIWFADNQFHAHVNQYRKHIDTIVAPTLLLLMTACSNKYGYD